MKKAIVSLALALVAAVAFALPTTQDVEAQVRQGNYSQAEAMMNEVVTARPGSARAHYVYAEILAHNRNFAKAADEAQKARQIDPALSFTDPAKFRAFEQLLAREQSAIEREARPHRGHRADRPERRPRRADPRGAATRGAGPRSDRITGLDVGPRCGRAGLGRVARDGAPQSGRSDRHGRGPGRCRLSAR